jgi:hypothetical protein
MADSASRNSHLRSEQAIILHKIGAFFAADSQPVSSSPLAIISQLQHLEPPIGWVIDYVAYSLFTVFGVELSSVAWILNNWHATCVAVVSRVVNLKQCVFHLVSNKSSFKSR